MPAEVCLERLTGEEALERLKKGIKLTSDVTVRHLLINGGSDVTIEAATEIKLVASDEFAVVFVITSNTQEERRIALNSGGCVIDLNYGHGAFPNVFRIIDLFSNSIVGVLAKE